MAKAAMQKCARRFYVVLNLHAIKEDEAGM